MAAGITSVSQGAAQYANQTTNTKKTTSSNSNQTSKTQDTSTDAGDAYSLNISDDAKKFQQSQQTQKNSSELSVDENNTQETKGLTDEQTRYIEESMAMNERTMLNLLIQALTESNDKLQGWADDGIGFLNFDGTLVDAASFGLPEVATNPEDAAKAVGEGGDWSVDAVATRIFDLATAIAGDDAEKLATMRSAIEEGFKQAGATWTNATGLQDMPEITKQTYNEIMSRFDQRTNELNGTVTTNTNNATSAVQ